MGSLGKGQIPKYKKTGNENAVLIFHKDMA